MRSPSARRAALLGALLASPTSAFAVEVEFVPRSEVQVAYDDNVRKAPAAEGDVLLTLAPGFALRGEGSQTKFDLDYSPQIRRYRKLVSENGTDHRLSAAGTLAAEPDLQFIDLRAYASDRSATGTLASGGSLVVPKGDRSQLVSYSAEPVWRWPADDNLQIESRYKFERTVATTPSQPTSNAVSGTTSTHSASVGAMLGSEGSLARLGPQFQGQMSRGRGALAGARNLAGLLVGDVRPEAWIDLKATIGYERVRYGGGANYDRRGIRWEAGFDVELSEDTRLVGSYGRRDGGPAYDVRVEQTIGSRTQLVAAASRRIGTNLQEIQRALSGSSLQGGTFVNPSTQLPVNVADGNFGLTDQLFRQERQSVTLRYRGEVDLLSAEPFLERRRRTGLIGTDQDDAGATLAWSHDLSELSSLRLRGTMRWQRTRAVANDLSQSASRERIGEVGLTYTTELSDSFTLSADYVYALRRGNGPTLPYEGKVATLVLRKSF